jgi:uncharacterized sulfatase
MTEAVRKLRDRPAVEPEIVDIGDGVYVAVGFSAGYFSMIEGDNGIVLVDSGGDPYEAASVMSMFRKISDKPLKAVIFTHAHPDHTGGITGVIGMETARCPGLTADSVEIWARANFGGNEAPLARLLPQAFALRAERQFGKRVPPEKLDPPLGPRVLPDPGKNWPVASGPVKPNRLFAEDRVVLTLAGRTLELHAMPSETTDHLLVWMPAEKIAFTGDAIYGSFPNLYPVRGSTYRDVDAWAKSLKKIQDMLPGRLVMGHSPPLTDSAVCAEWLGNYHDAVRYVFDATISGMNRGMSADELAESVRLPAHLAEKEYLSEYYGNVGFSVRSIFANYLGWFDGDARKLSPLGLKEEAEHMAEMAGGVEELIRRAAGALAARDYAWAAQLASYVLRLEPGRKDAGKINGEALMSLGEAMLSTSGRNYLMTAGLESMGQEAGRQG